MSCQKYIHIVTAILALITCALIGAQRLPDSRAFASGPSQEIPPVEDFTVLWVEEIDLLAGPIHTAAYLAPDGEQFAYFTEDEEICLYTVTGEMQRCTPIPEDIRLVDYETVSWSLDSHYLAFTDEFFRTYLDSDIWLWDAESGDLRNLTEDQFNGSPIMNPAAEVGPVDVLAVWSSDSSRILFVRYASVDTEHSPANLFTITPDGSDLQQIGSLDGTDGLATSALDWSSDGSQIAYTIWKRDDEAMSGVWISDVDGSNPRQVLQVDPTLVPSTVTFSADGDYVLTFTPRYLNTSNATYEPESSPIRIISIEDGTSQLPSADTWVGGAAWAPAGHALAYVPASRVLDEEDSGLYLSAGPGEPGRLVLQGWLAPPTGRWEHPLTWTANHTILLSRSPAPGIVVLRLGVEE